MPANIDELPTAKSLIDFSRLPRNSFNSTFVGYTLKTLLDNIILVKYEDESDDGTTIKRGSIHVPLNADVKAWRIGKVVLAGVNTKFVKVGDLVCFPHNLGVNISDLTVANYGKLDKGIFLDETRIFGICSLTTDESIIINTKDNPPKQRNRDKVLSKNT